MATVRSERGAATVEQAGLSLLIAVIAIAGIAALSAQPSGAGRELGSTLGRKLRCGAVGPGPCWRDPLTEAYGRSLAGAARALAPAPRGVAEPGGAPIYPVDFRRCRTIACALGGDRPGHTASGKRMTEFTAVDDRRPAAGSVRIDYWGYRPTIGWELVRRTVSSADVERLAPTPLPEDAIPELVALETLDGRNHYDFAPGEQPPWRWQVESVYP